MNTAIESDDAYPILRDRAVRAMDSWRNLVKQIISKGIKKQEIAPDIDFIFNYNHLLMLQFYYHPLSPLARRVWLALLEKNLQFESIIVDLDRGEQLKPDFLNLNPFHHVPVLIDGDLRIIESLAILDYLEIKYPEISLLPNDPEKLAVVKMAQMVVNSELGSQVIPLIFEDANSIKVAQAKRHLKRVCKFLVELLGDNPYFGGKQLTTGDIVAGNGLILIDKLGFKLNSFPNLEHYRQRLMAREPWQIAQPNQEQIQAWQKTIKVLFAKKVQTHS